ncbi:MAG: DUF5928 domain-containing protein [Pseudomonadota bacterium]
MARIAYLVLAHNRPLELAETVKTLTVNGDYAVIHFDKNAPQRVYSQLRQDLAVTPNVVFVKRRKCGWGGWSLVGATLDMLETAEASFEDATHFYLISGACAPIKPRGHIDQILKVDPKDHIETADLVRSDWIKTGMRADRFQYRHFFNERTQTSLFYRSLNLQRKWKLARPAPSGLEMKVGSQWWCLRRKTVEAVLEYVKQNPSVVTFFKTTWIPDESFFQTIVARLVPEAERTGRPPTLLMFTDYGLPVVFHSDHVGFLTRQPGFFARKISTHSSTIRSELNDLYLSSQDVQTTNTDPRQHYQLIANAGRTGDRFSQRIWDKSVSVPRDKELIIISAKRWDEGDWLRRAVCDATGIPGVGYLFNTNNAELPDLGGLESHVDKRSHHRRAVVRLLFDIFDTNRLVIGLDPESTEVFDDLAKDRCAVSVIYIDRDLNEAYFKGHAERTGRISQTVSDDDWQEIYRSLKARHERSVEELQHPRLLKYAEIKQQDSDARRAEALASVLDCSAEQAQSIIQTSQILKDS